MRLLKLGVKNMSLSKVLVFFSATTLFALSAGTHAAVNDFADTDATPLVHSASADANTSNNSMSFLASADTTESLNGGNNHFRRDAKSKNDASKNVKSAHTFTPVASQVPEPETYAMILVGLGLIGFTTRRRK